MPTLVENTGAGFARVAEEFNSVRTALDGKSDTGHTHAAVDINDATAVGRSVLTAANATAARGAIGAGTSSLTIGTTSDTAKAGNYQPTAADVSDATAVGRAVLTAVSNSAARDAIGAGTSSLTLGTTGSTAAAGNHVHAYGDLSGIPSTFAPSAHTHTASQISDATAIGRSTLTAADGPAIRTLIGAGTSSLAIGSTGSTAKAGNWFPTFAEVTSKPATYAPTIGATSTTAVAGNDARLTDARTPTTHVHSQGDITGLSASLAAKADLVGGLVPTSQIPPLALNTSVPVANQAAMLALTASQVQPGDLAIRADGAGTFMLMAADASVLANWTLLSTPTNTVTSVNSQTGAVVLGKADVGLGNVDNTADSAKPISSLTQTALNAKEPTVTAGTTAQYYRGDKSWQAHDKASVGLGNVDNTADATKNSAAAALTNKDLTSGTNTFPTFNQSTSGNAATATKLATARNINGVPFDGTGNITVADSTKEPALPGGGTTAQYLRGDKSWQTHDKASVGLGNVDDTSDNGKPVSSATQSALDLKSNLNDARFTDARTPTAHNHPQSDVTGLVTALSGKAPTVHSHAISEVTSLQGALDGKSATGHTHAQGDVTGLTTSLAGKADTSHIHAVGDTTGLQTALDSKATKAASTLGTGLPWSIESIVNGGDLVDGWNDLPGGLMVDADIVLSSFVIRLGNLATNIGGTGNLQVQFYTGAYDAANQAAMTLIHTAQIAAGVQGGWPVLSSPLSVSINTCLRAYFTKGSTTVVGPVHFQARGRYA